jgi:hypothetical protein
MKARKIIGALFFGAGLLLLIVFAAADIFFLGDNPFNFGTWQIGGCIIGAAGIAIGLVLLLKRNQPVSSEKADRSD